MGASDASRYLSMQPSSVIIFASVHCPHEAPHAAPPSTARDNKRPGHQDDGGTPVVVVVVVVVKPPLHSATWRTQRKAKVEQHHPRLTIVLVSLRVDAAADDDAMTTTTKTAAVTHQQQSAKRDGQSTKRNTTLNYKLQRKTLNYKLQRKNYWQRQQR